MGGNQRGEGWEEEKAEISSPGHRGVNQDEEEAQLGRGGVAVWTNTIMGPHLHGVNKSQQVTFLGIGVLVL